MEDVNVWIFEETYEILVTDQTGGVSWAGRDMAEQADEIL